MFCVIVSALVFLIVIDRVLVHKLGFDVGIGLVLCVFSLMVRCFGVDGLYVCLCVLEPILIIVIVLVLVLVLLL